MQEDTKRKRRMGALLSAFVMGGFILIVTVCMLFDYFGSGATGAETVMILIAAAMFLLIVAGIAAALWQRWREIERGEEDEAGKY